VENFGIGVKFCRNNVKCFRLIDNFNGGAVISIDVLGF
jgi:hypothetical protein